MASFDEKPHIALRDGYWRVSLTPPQYWGRRGESQLWVQANAFANRLNEARRAAAYNKETRHE